MGSVEAAAAVSSSPFCFSLEVPLFSLLFPGCGSRNNSAISRGGSPTGFLAAPLAILEAAAAASFSVAERVSFFPALPAGAAVAADVLTAAEDPPFSELLLPVVVVAVVVALTALVVVLTTSAAELAVVPFSSDPAMVGNNQQQQR